MLLAIQNYTQIGFWDENGIDSKVTNRQRNFIFLKNIVGLQITVSRSEMIDALFPTSKNQMREILNSHLAFHFRVARYSLPNKTIWFVYI